MMFWCTFMLKPIKYALSQKSTEKIQKCSNCFQEIKIFMHMYIAYSNPQTYAFIFRNSSLALVVADLCSFITHKFITIKFSLRVSCLIWLISKHSFSSKFVHYNQILIFLQKNAFLLEQKSCTLFYVLWDTIIKHL